MHRGLLRAASCLGAFRGACLGACALGFFLCPRDAAAVEAAAAESVAYKLPEVVVQVPRDSVPLREDLSADFISRDQIRRTPATADDVFRVVQTLPGVASTDFSSSFLIRGGESDETLVRYEGIDLLEPYHIPYWGGAISVVSPDAVRSIRLQRGGLPARYGRQLSGALEINAPDQRPSGPRYRVGAGPTQLRAFVTGPTEGEGSYLFGVRHGLLAAIGRLQRSSRGAGIEPDFQDMIGELRLKPASGQELLFLALGAREKIRYDMPYDESDLNGTIRNMTVGATWTLRPSDRVRHRAVFSADRFQRQAIVGRRGHDDGTTRALRARLEGEIAFEPGGSVEWGVAGEYEDGWLSIQGIQGSMIESGYQEQLSQVLAGTATRRRVEGFVSLRSPIGPGDAVTLGVNVSRDFYSWGLRRDGAPVAGTPGFAFYSPRLSVSGNLGSAGIAWASMGLMRQPLFLNTLSQDRGALPLGRKREAAEALVGFEARPGGVTLRAEGYARSEMGVGLPVQDATTHPAPSFPLDRGTSRGLEVMVRTPQWARADASIGYAWSRARWVTPAGDIPRSMDQPHAATLALNVRPVGLWNLNATARRHTGSPYTAAEWVWSDESAAWTRRFGAFMGARYPDYFRLDFRLSHPVSIGLSGGEVYLELINATGHENVHMYTYSFRDHRDGMGRVPTRQAIELFPRLPSAGFEFSF